MKRAMMKAEPEKGHWRPEASDDRAGGRSSDMKRAMTTAQPKEGHCDQTRTTTEPEEGLAT
jgi:hypothetical protein